MLRRMIIGAALLAACSQARADEPRDVFERYWSLTATRPDGTTCDRCRERLIALRKLFGPQASCLPQRCAFFYLPHVKDEYRRSALELRCDGNVQWSDRRYVICEGDR